MNNIGNKWWMKNRWWSAVGVLFVALMAVLIWAYCKYNHVSEWLQISTLTAGVAFAIGLCNTLTNIFSLRRQESGITWCQIIILFAIIGWLLGFIWIFNIQSGNNSTIAFTVIGGLLTVIFQEKLKGVVTFIHLRFNNLLSIGDWIQVPKMSVDGEVRKITLTTVTLSNFDTTTSTIPISALHSEHFINLQNMNDGKTYGWRMSQPYIVDTESFKPVTQEEAEKLKSDEFNKLHNILGFVPKEDIKEGVFNAALYRVYLYHWLMNYPKISQKPRLNVRWIDQVEGGMQLLVYVFIITDSINEYEWEMSLITEHVAESLGWFGLRLYQRPSSYDITQGKETEL